MRKKILSTALLTYGSDLSCLDSQWTNLHCGTLLVSMCRRPLGDATVWQLQMRSVAEWNQLHQKGKYFFIESVLLSLKVSRSSAQDKTAAWQFLIFFSFQ